MAADLRRPTPPSRGHNHAHRTRMPRRCCTRRNTPRRRFSADSSTARTPHPLKHASAPVPRIAIDHRTPLRAPKHAGPAPHGSRAAAHAGARRSDPAPRRFRTALLPCWDTPVRSPAPDIGPGRRCRAHGTRHPSTVRWGEGGGRSRSADRCADTRVTAAVPRNEGGAVNRTGRVERQGGVNAEQYSGANTAQNSRPPHGGRPAPSAALSTPAAWIVTADRDCGRDYCAARSPSTVSARVSPMEVVTDSREASVERDAIAAT